MQQGIQARHAWVELWLKYQKKIVHPDWSSFYVVNAECKEYQERAMNHKTVIVLNWGGSQELESHMKHLDDLWITYSTFREPDMENMLTAIAFLWEKWDKVTSCFTPLFKLA